MNNEKILDSESQIFGVPSSTVLRDLGQDAILSRQSQQESEVRSYPRRIPIAIERADGVIVTDTRGQQYLDCLAGAGTLALGYNHPEINKAITDALASAVPYQTLDLTTPTKDKFVQTLLGFLPKSFADNAKIQFCGPSGAAGVEAAIKLAKQTTGRNTIFAFHGGYHGMTNGAMAMTGNLGAKERRTGLMADVHFLPFPYSYRCPFGLGGDAGAWQSIRYIEHVLNDVESGIQKPAAIIVEPIQGEGGVIPAPAFWLQELRRITKELDILLIFDEIQCGIGKSGSHFAYEYSGIHPDILVMSKAVGGGLPLSVLAFDKSIDSWRPGEHTGTFRGNQLAMATGAKALEIIQRDNLVANAQAMGDRLTRHLLELQKKHPCIGEVRGRGLMLGIEIVHPEQKNRFGQYLANGERAIAIQRAALERGLIIEKGGRSGCVLRFLPPMIINSAQIDFVADVIVQAILATA